MGACRVGWEILVSLGLYHVWMFFKSRDVQVGACARAGVMVGRSISIL